MYDVIIIGTGPAGMTAAPYASQSNLSVLMIERSAPGGQMNNTAEVENYPGLDSIMGPELAYRIYENVEKFGTEDAYGIVMGTEDHGSYREMICDDKSYEVKAVIIVTGCEHRKLGVKGEGESTDRGVPYCAICDGAFFKNERLVVVGGGDSAVEEAIYLTQSTSEVMIVHRRDELRAQKIIQDRAFANEKISFVWDTVVEEIIGNEMAVTGVKTRNVKTDKVSETEANDVFIYMELDPLTEPFKKAGITNGAGWIETDQEMRTEIPGIYTIGDAREKTSRQITTAVGEGGVVRQQVFNYIEELK